MKVSRAWARESCNSDAHFSAEAFQGQFPWQWVVQQWIDLANHSIAKLSVTFPNIFGAIVPACHSFTHCQSDFFWEVKQPEHRYQRIGFLVLRSSSLSISWPLPYPVQSQWFHFLCAFRQPTFPAYSHVRSNAPCMPGLLESSCSSVLLWHRCWEESTDMYAAALGI